MREDHTLESQGHYKKKSMNQHKRSSTKGGKKMLELTSLHPVVRDSEHQELRPLPHLPGSA